MGIEQLRSELMEVDLMIEHAVDDVNMEEEEEDPGAQSSGDKRGVSSPPTTQW